MHNATHINNTMKKTSLKENFLMNILLTASSILFPLITFPYVSRVLLPVGNGKITFVSSVTAYFTLLFLHGGFPGDSYLWDPGLRPGAG